MTRIEANISQYDNSNNFRVSLSKLGKRVARTCTSIEEARAFKMFVKSATSAPNDWNKAFDASNALGHRGKLVPAKRTSINPVSRISPLVIFIYGMIAFNLASIVFITWLVFFSGINMKPSEKIELPAATNLSQASIEDQPKEDQPEEDQPEEQRAAQEPAPRVTASLPGDLIVSMGAKDRNNALKLYVFADPTCGACKELEPALEKMPDVAITIIPAPILETGDRFMGGISCAKDKLAAWKAAINEGVAMDGSCATGGDAHIRAYNFFKAAGFGSTPTLIAGDGRIHAGSMYGDVKKIRAWLAGGK